MWFETNANGINIILRIDGYKPINEDNWYSEWCECDFSFSSGNWLNYHRENAEVLLSSEVEDLVDAFTKLLDNKLSEVEEITCIEPDFVFKLYPQTDLRNDTKYIYIQPGFEFQDIYLEWRVYFWDEGLTDNYLTITLGRERIVKMRDYLASVIKQ